MSYEKIAINTMGLSLSKTTMLDPFLNSGDKEPSWDGNVYIHSDSEKSKKNIAKVPVQVKGKGVSEWGESKIKYPVAIVDLDNYFRDGGTMFFVVYIDKETNDAKRIYYAALLPMKILTLKEESRAEREMLVEFNDFPEDNKEKANIFLTFQANKEEQAILISGRARNVEELERKGMLEKISFTCTGIDLSAEDIPRAMVSNSDMYMYASIKDTDIKIPYRHISNISYADITEENRSPVSVGKAKYYDLFYIVSSSEGNEIRVGKSFRIKGEKIKMPDGTQVIKPREVVFTTRGNVTERIRDLQFVIEVIKQKEMALGECIIKFSKMKENGKKEVDVTLFQRDLEFLEQVERLLKTLHVKQALDLDICEKKEFESLEIIVEGILRNKVVKYLEEDPSGIIVTEVGNLKLAFFIEKTKDEGYKIYDFFTKSIRNEAIIDDEKVEISRFYGMKAENFLEIANISYGEIVKDYKNLKLSSVAVECANSTLLELVKAYDVCQCDELYEALLQLALWLLGTPEDYLEKDIKYLNLYQIFRRKRALKHKEKEVLRKISQEGKDNCKMGALILLEETEEARKIMATFPEKERKDIETTPIYRLMSK